MIMEKKLETIASSEASERECKVPEETLRTAELTRVMCYAAGMIAGIAAIGAVVATVPTATVASTVVALRGV